VQKFYQTLEEPEQADAMQVLDVLEILYRATGKHLERHRFEILVQALRERCPEFYAERAPFYLDWMIANALLAGREAEAAAMVMAMVEHAGNQVDIFFEPSTDWSITGKWRHSCGFCLGPCPS
jgi:hypothetical protein